MFLFIAIKINDSYDYENDIPNKNLSKIMFGK